MNFLAVRHRVAIFLLLLPLLIAALPLLQSYRIHVTEQERAYLTRFLAEGGATAGSPLRVPREFSRYARQSLAGPVQEALRHLDEQRPSLMARRALSAAGLLSALGAFALGIVILAKIRRDSARARRSFAFLVTHFEASWRQVSRLQLLHIALMTTTLVAGVLYEVAWSHSNWATHGYVAIAMTLPLWGAIGCAIALLLRAIRSMSPPAPVTLDVLGRSLSRADAPALWAWVADIATRIDAPTPDHIVVGLQECFYVTSADVRLHPSAHWLQGRTLYLPLPYVSVLSQDETAAIIGHELGHFAHGDTDHGNALAMVHRKMHQKIEALIAHHVDHASWLSEPPIWTAIHVVESFEHAYLHWSRLQELAADQAGARATDAATSARALVRVTAVATAIDDASLDGATHTNHVQALLDHLGRHDLTVHADVLDSAIAHPIDSHPPTRSRIDALGVAVDASLIRAATRRPTPEDTGWFTRTLTPSPHPA